MGVEQLSEEEMTIYEEIIKKVEDGTARVREMQLEIFDLASELQDQPLADKERVGGLKGGILADRLRNILRIDKKGRR